jgi:hypothetical protein
MLVITRFFIVPRTIFPVYDSLSIQETLSPGSGVIVSAESVTGHEGDHPEPIRVTQGQAAVVQSCIGVIADEPDFTSNLENDKKIIN